MQALFSLAYTIKFAIKKGSAGTDYATIEKLHRFIDAQGLKLAGKHHEIYLSDTRRAASAKWKTIIRQPVE